jgi:hypothetical protein
MSLEAWNTIFAGATFAVIAATALAALVQLRHLRSSNQLNALLTLMQMWDKPEMQRHIAYTRVELPEKIKDPAFLAAIGAELESRVDHPELLVADFWEQIGSFMKYNLMDERSWLDAASSQAIQTWNDLEPVVMALRKLRGPAIYENFEYVAVRAELWTKRSPDGYYPKGTPRMDQLKGKAKT